MASNPVAVRTLGGVRLLRGLDPAALEELARRAEPVSVEAGGFLFRRGDTAHELYVVQSGRLHVLVDGDDGPRVAREIGPGEAVGELALLTGSSRSASVQAVRDSELLAIDASLFDTLLREDLAFSRLLVGELARQLQASRGIDAPSTRPRVFSIVPLAPHVDVAPLADAMARELARFGSVDSLRGVESAEGPAATLARAEAACDAVLLVAGRGDPRWDAFCRRQGDRTVLVADQTTPPADASGCDLVLYAPMPTGATRRWLDETRPAAHHLVYDVAFEVGAARVARRLAGRSLGVVLSGGGARGLAHIGAVAAITEAGFDIDRIGGCSIGALIAGMAALGLDADQIRERCHAELVERKPFNDWTLPRVALIRSRKAERMLQRLFGELQVEELARPFFTVSADLVTTHTVVHRTGPLVEAVGASMSIPGLAPPRASGRQLLIDGGVLNNLPVDLMHESREGPVVAIDVVRRLDLDAPGAARRLPPIMETMTRATVLGSAERAERNRALATLVISPDLHGVGLRDFSVLDHAIAVGRAAAEEALREDGAALRAALQGPA